MLRALITQANETPELRNVFSTFQADVPQIWVDVDREKAKKQGVPLDEIFATLQTQLGSFYVNDFNKFGRVYRVILQAARNTGRSRRTFCAYMCGTSGTRWCRCARWSACRRRSARKQSAATTSTARRRSTARPPWLQLRRRDRGDAASRRKCCRRE